MVILRAAVEELGAAGYGSFAIESVAARAGVAKTTIYRHWPDRQSLIADAFETFHEHLAPTMDHATPRARVEALLRHVADVVVDSAFSRAIPALIDGAARDSRIGDFLHRYSSERRRELALLIAEGLHAKQFSRRIDPDVAATALLGSIFYRRLMSDRPLDPAEVVPLIDAVLAVSPAGDRGRSSRRGRA
jgi:TetR/AcrR family transcriptional regulator of autoinduction and epiphytic fitness